MDMGAYVYMKQKKIIQDSLTVFFDIHQQFFGPDHVAWQAAKAERILQISYYDGEKREWDWDKYVALLKEQHKIMKSADHGYNDIDEGTKVCYFYKGIKSA